MFDVSNYKISILCCIIFSQPLASVFRLRRCDSTLPATHDNCTGLTATAKARRLSALALGSKAWIKCDNFLLWLVLVYIL